MRKTVQGPVTGIHYVQHLFSLYDDDYKLLMLNHQRSAASWHRTRVCKYRTSFKVDFGLPDRRLNKNGPDGKLWSCSVIRDMTLGELVLVLKSKIFEWGANKPLSLEELRAEP